MAAKKKYSASKEVKAIARERVGTPKPARPIDAKGYTRKQKHKQQDAPASGRE